MLARQQAQEAFLNICLTLIDNECWECKGPAHLWNNTTASSWKVFHHSQMNFYISSRYLLKLGSPVRPNSNTKQSAGTGWGKYSLLSEHTQLPSVCTHPVKLGANLGNRKWDPEASSPQHRAARSSFTSRFHWPVEPSGEAARPGLSSPCTETPTEDLFSAAVGVCKHTAGHKMLFFT